MKLNIPRRSLRRLVPFALLPLLVLAACGGGDSDTPSSDTTGDGGSTEPTAAPDEGGDEATTIRLGYFANVTHAPAVVAEAEGFFEEALGDDVEIEYSYYNSGTEVIEAMFAGALDASFIGPNPAINGFAQSDGEALRIVSGTTSGGASLIVQPEITSAADLEGKKLATPSLGNTQDVALRAWLQEQGYETDETGGGDVSILPQENADTLVAFQEDQIDGAWVPEPWATRLLLEGDGVELLDESELWEGGQFVTTQVIVATEFLDANPGIVRGVLSGLLDALDFIEANPDEAKTITNAGIERITTKALAPETIDGAWEKLTFTFDPIAASLEGSKEDAVAVGLLDPVDLEGIYDLTILNELLAERGLEEIELP